MMMTSTFRRHAVKGFTLIELLIVVIIIAILAAIAIPQFSNTSTDAQESAAIANLTTMRSAIELYRVQHNGVYPSKVPTGTAPTCSDSTATSTDNTSGTTTNSGTTFSDQLTKFSSVGGHTCSTAAAGYSFGPYLRAIPTEPITGSNAVVVVATATATPIPGAATVGWRFISGEGKLQINRSGLARDGVTALSDK